MKLLVGNNLATKSMGLIYPVVFMGLSLGFLTTITVGPSYTLLLRSQLREIEIDKKAAAVTGVIIGQLIIQISIIYRPLHLCLGQPHILTLLLCPVFLVFLFHNLSLMQVDDPYSDILGVPGNQSIYYYIAMYRRTLFFLFWNNLILQLFNNNIYPNPIFFRLGNIYLFRYNNTIVKILFLVSSFFGWYIGHLFFVKCLENYVRWRLLHLRNFSLARTIFFTQSTIKSKIKNSVSELKYRYLGSELKHHLDPILRIMRFVLAWIWKNFISRLIARIRSNKSLIEELRYWGKSCWYFMGEVNYLLSQPQSFFTFLFTIVLGFYFSKMPPPFGTAFMPQTAGKHYSFVPGGDTEKIKRKILFLEFDEGNFLRITDLYNIFQFHRPVRYVNKNRLDIAGYKDSLWALRNEQSQLFFYPSLSDGKERISFTYPPRFSFFWKQIQAKTPFNTISCDELNDYDYWISTNEKKKNRLIKEFRDRIKVLELNRNQNYRFFKIFIKKKSIIFRFFRNQNFTIFHFFKKKDKYSLYSNFFRTKNALFLLVFRKKNSTFSNVFEKKKRLGRRNYFGFLNFTTRSYIAERGDPLLTGPRRRRKTKDKRQMELDRIKPQPLRLRLSERMNKRILDWRYLVYGLLEGWDLLYRRSSSVHRQIRTKKFYQVLCYNKKKQNEFFNGLGLIKKNYEPHATLMSFTKLLKFFYRNRIINMTMRSQRRKINVYCFYQVLPFSPLFPNRLGKPFLIFLLMHWKLALQEAYSCYFRKPDFLILIEKEKAQEEGERKAQEEGERKAQEERERKAQEERERKAQEEREKKEEKEIEIEQIVDPKAPVVKADSIRDPDLELKIEEERFLEDPKDEDLNYSIQPLRSIVLLLQSFLRKKVYLPVLIRIKNRIRLLLGQSSELSEDERELAREVHIACTLSGIECSPNLLPTSWFLDGMHMKIVYPFRLLPWRDESNLENVHPDPKENFCFLTVFGTETYNPYGPSPGFRERPPLFRPIFTELQKRIKRGWGIRDRLFSMFSNLPKKTKKIILTNFPFDLQCIKRLLEIINKQTNIEIAGLSKQIADIEENKEEILVNELRENQNQGVEENQFVDLSIETVEEKYLNDLTESASKVINEIERILTEKKTKVRSIERNIKRKGVRLRRKANYLFKFFTEKIKSYLCLAILKTFLKKKKAIDIFFDIINFIFIKDTEIFLELQKKMIDGYTYIYDKYFFNTERHEKRKQKERKERIKEYEKERIKKPTKETMKFFWKIKESLFFFTKFRGIFNNLLADEEAKKMEDFEFEASKDANMEDNFEIFKNSKIFYDFSFLSQAYVFYKLSQTKVPNQLRSVLQYHRIFFVLKNDKEVKDYFQREGISFFLKKEIKDCFRKQGIIESQLKDKKFQNSIVQQWKNWLKSHYQHKISPYHWSILAPQEWRNSVTQRYSSVKNSQLSKGISYKKDRLSHYSEGKGADDYVVLLPNPNDDKVWKPYRYDRLASNYIYFEEKKEKKDSFSSSSLTKMQEGDYLSNYYKILKLKKFQRSEQLFTLNYIGNYRGLIKGESLIDGPKKRDRKYFDFSLVRFFSSRKIIMKKERLRTDHNRAVLNQKRFQERFDNPKIWFFPDLLVLSPAYKKKAYAIPRNLLFGEGSYNTELTYHRYLDLDSRYFTNEEEEVKWLKHQAIKRNPIFYYYNLLTANAKPIEQQVKEKRREKLIKRLRSRKETPGVRDIPQYLSAYQIRPKIDLLDDEDEFEDEDEAREDIVNCIKTASILVQAPTLKGRKRDKFNQVDIAVDTLKTERIDMKTLRQWGPRVRLGCEERVFLKRVSIRLFTKENFAKKKKLRRLHVPVLNTTQRFRSIEFIELKCTAPLKDGILILEQYSMSMTKRGKLLMYQTLSLLPKMINRYKREKEIVFPKYYGRLYCPKRYNRYYARRYFSVLKYKNRMKKVQDIYKKDYYLPFLIYPENILSPRSRRELRILSCFNSKNCNDGDQNTIVCNRNKVQRKNCSEPFTKSKGRELIKLIKLKKFLWPYYRLEDLACMNRYWFNTCNGSRFSMLRILLYPRF